MKIRDILAIPFWSLAQLLDYIAVAIGGVWTAKLIKEKLTNPTENYE